MSQQTELSERVRRLSEVEPRVIPPLEDLARKLATGQSPRTKSFGLGLSKGALRDCFSDFVRFDARQRAVLDVKRLAERLGGYRVLAEILPASTVGAPPTPPVPAETHETPSIQRLLESRSFQAWARGATAETSRRVRACAGALLDGVDVSYAHLGARFFNDSKILRPKTDLHTILGGWLKSEFEIDGSLDDAFFNRGVYTNPTAVRVMVYGPIIYVKDGIRRTWIHDLWQAGEAAVLHLDHLNGATDFALTQAVAVHSSENESPFYDLVKNRDVDCAIYTEGYPNTAVCRLLRGLALPTIYHWGDTDVDGWRIAEQLNRCAPVRPWRCTLDDAKRLRDRLRPMDRIKCGRAREILLKSPAFPFRAELEFAVNNGWLEQEAWIPAEPA